MLSHGKLKSKLLDIAGLNYFQWLVFTHIQKRKLVLVGAMDISFLKENPSTACCTLVVCNIPQLEVIYEDSQIVEMTVPYTPGRVYLQIIVLKIMN